MIGFRYGVSWGPTKDPEAPEQSQLIAQWSSYVHFVLQTDGLQSMIMPGEHNMLWFNDSFEPDMFPTTLVEAGFELQALQYGLRIYFKQVSAPPPSYDEVDQKGLAEAPQRKQTYRQCDSPKIGYTGPTRRPRGNGGQYFLQSQGQPTGKQEAAYARLHIRVSCQARKELGS